MERTMSTREKLIKARMGMLALAEELSNVSKACQRAGFRPVRRAAAYHRM
jgi:hypothetical protein